MPNKPRISVMNENSTGRNTSFHDNRTGENMSRAQFARAIESGKYNDYHVRSVNGIKTPASNPNGRSIDNLG